MGLFGGLNSWALKKMAKESFERGWRRGCGCGGQPPVGAVRAIERAAETAGRYTELKNYEMGIEVLSGNLQDLADALNKNVLQIAVGAGVLCGLFAEFPGYEWAAYYVSEWELYKLYS
ncbi:hypothetical protein [Adlercreutzia murintestinalis]|uniref:hypothetical protein n=1 Tax=Adlercreutzia murintestinalis TaxID=2941325 RepID=UPI00203BAB72|nr:hypothetical protein [Adlercreutzia murintestinalis]